MTKIQPLWLLAGLAVRQKADAKPSRVAAMRAALGKGYGKNPTYVSWCCMFNRCYRPYTNGFHNYGGRGIVVCARWWNFLNFRADMGERPNGKQIDREDAEKHYRPSNCRWLTAKESARNRRHVPVPFLPDETDSEHRTKVHRQWRLANWDERKRYKKKWASSPEQILKTKARGRRYYLANRQRLKRAQREYYCNNREKILAQENARYQRNKITVTSLAARD